MPKPLNQIDVDSLQHLYAHLKGAREQIRTKVSVMEKEITKAIDMMGQIQHQLDALAKALGMPDGTSRE